MPKEEWGTKRLCPHCNTRFYDLQRDPMTCPACGAEFTVESLQSGRGRALVSEKSAASAGDQANVVYDEYLDDDTDDEDVSLDDIADVASDDD